MGEKALVRKYKIFHEEKVRILEKLEKKIKELSSLGYLIEEAELVILENINTKGRL